VHCRRHCAAQHDRGLVSLGGNVIESASDGTTSQWASVAEALNRNPKLLEQVAEQVEAIEKNIEIIDTPKADNIVGETVN